MKTIILCKDCLGCCGASELKKTNVIEPSKSIKIIQTKCMGICPAGKVSTIILEDNEVNEFEITPLTIEQINTIL